MMYEYNAIVLRVVDGDTVQLYIDLGLHIWRKENSRLAHINAAELNSEDPVERTLAQKAKARVEELLPVGRAVNIVSHSLDKYGRPLVSVYIAPGVTINSTLVSEGLAKEY
jgi:micrococcal nuclease